MGPSINLHETSRRQPLRQRRVFANVNDDIPQQQPYKEGCRQLRRPHAPAPSRGKTHPTRCVARPPGKYVVDENRPAVKEGQGQVPSKEVLLRMHREVNVDSSSTSKPITVGTTTAAAAAAAAAAIRVTSENLTEASQDLGGDRRITSSGTMHSAALGDVRGELEHWRNHYSRSTIGSLSYVKSPLDVFAATDPTRNASFISNFDSGRRRRSPRLAADGPGLSCRGRPRRRCCICGPERSYDARDGVARVGEGDVVEVQHRPARLPPTTRTALSLIRPASAEGCWFCEGGRKAVGERAADGGSDRRNVMAAPSATVGGHVFFSGGRALLDSRAGEPKVRDSHIGSVERRLEVSAERQTENGMSERVEIHAGMQTGSGVGGVGEEQGRQEVQVTGCFGARREAIPMGRERPPAAQCAAGGLGGRSPKGSYKGAGEQRWLAGECRGSGGGGVGRGRSERLVDDGLAILLLDPHRRFLEHGAGQDKGTIMKDGSCKKAGVLEGTSYGDGSIGGRGGGDSYEVKKRNSANADGEIVRKTFPQNGPREGVGQICEAACFGDEGKSLAYAQAGDFGYPLCWEVDGVWWFHPV